MRVNIGDVILCNYYNFDGEKTTGLFVVVYHEVYDNRVSNNFTAIKVSTERYCYQVPLEKDYLKFLHHDSYLNCNQMFRFKEEQVLNIVGKLTPYYLNKMLQQTKMYFKKMAEELVLHIGQDNLFKDMNFEIFMEAGNNDRKD